MTPENSTDKSSVEARLLARIDLINASQACVLLRIETDDPEGAMQALARDDVIVTVVKNGEIRLPLFQFDVRNGRVFDVIGAILKDKPARISNLRLCYWLTRAHVDFRGPPADRFGRDDTEIVAAFGRYIEPVRHG
ncbi:hypothetical protein [Paenirhodobacter populi]|uniref:Uncharacterized protein n=1 Tax=Paenirhodobacter populi TaxID=2306993 RepID=A0A443JTN7_9RHOB|nr:hypothetical protein [Sinirhodobacter populi]RWR23856.1 hypothetical protein D2T30_01690 [Sinirhodobacter populi]